MAKVLIYTTSECPWCAKVKALFKKNGVKFTEKDVGKDAKAAQEMIKKSGQQGVPVIDIGGKIVVGYDEAKLKKLLKIK